MNNIETAISKAIKTSMKTEQTLYVYGTYYKVCISPRRPPFGAACWRVTGATVERIEDDYQIAKLAALS